ncbi:hypothetical protein [Hymenobacter latericus]|uniref:hypothetical protein n=1 Tax=Hymenobacter sp. YIM 151858-1 TaxID=2987688 RepID=UPI0022272E46|nr:hypothetical protein [Hymenobacter sp. YIM 151858-1]UYZ59836.1 hypothetical protein OIS50_03345 [Hymenobacter sp. YIM 151858-1]
MAFSSASRTRYLYWLAAGAIAVSLILNLQNGGTTWPRIASSAALFTGFALMGLYPTYSRPKWASTLIVAMLAVAIVLLILRVTGRLV